MDERKQEFDTYDQYMYHKPNDSFMQKYGKITKGIGCKNVKSIDTIRLIEEVTNEK